MRTWDAEVGMFCRRRSDKKFLHNLATFALSGDVTYEDLANLIMAVVICGRRVHVYIASVDDAVFLAELCALRVHSGERAFSVLGTKNVINPVDYRTVVVFGSRRDFESSAEEERYSGVRRHTALVVSGIDPRWLRRKYRQVLSASE
ncbi:hypothetical protein AB0P21_12595 [Kribbella sp. NPDC056861]|uniref:hypothetical protein n=1 Tax=Kribbella sp. NPDC056861 TaxID=3154857 RepID=UPI0034160BA4